MRDITYGRQTGAIYYFNPVRDAKYCVSACLHVCLSGCLSARISQKPQSKFHQMFYACYRGRGSVLLLQHCDTLCTSCFVDDVMFHIMEEKGQNQRRRVCFVQFGWQQQYDVRCCLLEIARWRHRGQSLLFPTADAWPAMVYRSITCYRRAQTPLLHYSLRCSTSCTTSRCHGV